MDPRLQSLSILVVDDDEDIRASMSLALRSEGGNILQAADGNEAVAMWRSHEPDVVVLDMMLPKRSGFLVLEELQEASEPPIVIMVTATGAPIYVRAADSAKLYRKMQNPGHCK